MIIRSLIITITIMILTTCNNDNELEGHWHLYVNESDKYNQYIVLNIRKDTIVDFDGVDYLVPGQEIGFLKNGKNINSDSQFILLYDGMYGLYDYQLDGNRIVLNERDGVTFMDTDYWGVRMDTDECDIITDLFSREQVEISLPKSTHLDSVVSLEDGFVFDIMVGNDKRSKWPAIQVGNNIIEREKLYIEFEKFKIKLPKSKHDELILRLSIDESLSLDFIGEQLDTIRAFPFKQCIERKVDKNKSIILVHIE